MLKKLPVFLSVVLEVKNQASLLQKILEDVFLVINPIVAEFEIIVIDNGSTDESLHVLEQLTGTNGIANLQVYALTKEVDTDTLASIGLENALGDFVAIFNNQTDDLAILEKMLHKALDGSDVVFADNVQKPNYNFIYKLANTCFNAIYRIFTGVHLEKEAPKFRLLSRKIINYILQHNEPSNSYRHLPATAGFSRSYINYSSPSLKKVHKPLWSNTNRGIQLLVSSTSAPLRLVTVLCVFGAVANVLYSFYVLLIAFTSTHVATGWISTSLQLSGMFFLFSLVLLVLGEYILQMNRMNTINPRYHIAREFTSARLTRLDKLNIEEAVDETDKTP